MITFSGVSLGRTLNGISFAFDGISLCIVSRDIKEAKAVTDLICGIPFTGKRKRGDKLRIILFSGVSHIQKLQGDPGRGTIFAVA